MLVQVVLSLGGVCEPSRVRPIIMASPVHVHIHLHASPVGAAANPDAGSTSPQKLPPFSLPQLTAGGEPQGQEQYQARGFNLFEAIGVKEKPWLEKPAPGPFGEKLKWTNQKFVLVGSLVFVLLILVVLAASAGGGGDGEGGDGDVGDGGSDSTSDVGGFDPNKCLVAQPGWKCPSGRYCKDHTNHGGMLDMMGNKWCLEAGHDLCKQQGRGGSCC